MNTRPLVSSGDSSRDIEAKTFRILAIYDTPESRREAAHAAAVVLRELGEDVIVHKNSWEAAAIEDESDREQAAAEAALADVILIALADNAPSLALKRWIDDWQKKRELNSGLLALIPCNESRSAGDLAEFLYETAVSARMDFICRKPRRF